MQKRDGSVAGARSVNQCTDLRIRIRIKMSRIRNTAGLRVVDNFEKVIPYLLVKSINSN
jgi:hypothetical protein